MSRVAKVAPSSSCAINSGLERGDIWPRNQSRSPYSSQCQWPAQDALHPRYGCHPCSRHPLRQFQASTGPVIEVTEFCCAINKTPFRTRRMLLSSGAQTIARCSQRPGTSGAIWSPPASARTMLPLRNEPCGRPSIKER